MEALHQLANDETILDIVTEWGNYTEMILKRAENGFRSRGSNQSGRNGGKPIANVLEGPVSPPLGDCSKLGLLGFGLGAGRDYLQCH